MDGLELRMDERRLNDRWQLVVVDRPAEIRKQARNFVWRRWDEVGAAWVVIVASDPVLNGPHLACDGSVDIPRHQGSMDGIEFRDVHNLLCCSSLDGEFHCVDVGQDVECL